jgi:DNA-binding response OmpR family regulator
VSLADISSALDGSRSWSSKRQTTSVLLVDVSGDDIHDLGPYLTRQGLSVFAADSDDHILDEAMNLGAFDVVVLVARLPDPAAMGAIRQISRRNGPPVLVVAREGAVLERVLALEMGADDLVDKQISPREVLARLHGLVRRRRAQPSHAPSETSDSGWTLKQSQRTLEAPDGRRIDLSSRDQALMNAFLDSADGFIFEHAYPGDHIRSAVSRLKRKAVQVADVDLPIQNVRGRGYRFDADLFSR